MTALSVPGNADGGATRLRARQDQTARGLLARSLATRRGAFLADAAVGADWLATRAQAHRHEVARVPLAEVDGWSTQPGTGNLMHRSGKFFMVAGLDVSVRTTLPDTCREWQQPIIVQPEIGILGILGKEFDGVLHFLMQAKMEPGNVNLLQLSPTVQATRSNYTGVHRGSPVPYLEYFTRPVPGQVITDVLQSEHGAWFSGKVNRNMIVVVTESVAVREDFCWLTLGQLGQLLRRDHVVAMDTRAVLACAPTTLPGPAALHSDIELLSWFNTEQSRYDIRVQRIPLNAVSAWQRDEWSIRHELGRYFQFVGVSVHAANREVPHWMQPLLAPVRGAVCAFILRRFGGVPHLLVNSRAEGGFHDHVELGPTVQCTPGNHGGADRPPFLDLVLEAPADRIRYATVQSEEGGRLLGADTSYLIVEADESQAATQPPPGYQWATVDQLSSLLQHGRYLNVQARTLLAAMKTGAADLIS
jgi:oxidase EvaA